MRHVHQLVGAVGVALTSLSCALGTGAAPDRQDLGPVEVRVNNRSWSDAAIYLVSEGLTQRLGLATAVGTTTLWVPERLLGPSGDFRLLSAPIGSNHLDATESLLVRPGQMVQITLENGFGLSSWGVW